MVAATKACSRFIGTCRDLSPLPPPALRSFPECNTQVYPSPWCVPGRLRVAGTSVSLDACVVAGNTFFSFPFFFFFLPFSPYPPSCRDLRVASPWGGVCVCVCVPLVVTGIHSDCLCFLSSFFCFSAGAYSVQRSYATEWEARTDHPMRIPNWSRSCPAFASVCSRQSRTGLWFSTCKCERTTSSCRSIVRWFPLDLMATLNLLDLHFLFRFPYLYP